MPKLTEESTQCFTPITKPSSDNILNSTNVITPVPIHANSTIQSNGKIYFLFSLILK